MRSNLTPATVLSVPSRWLVLALAAGLSGGASQAVLAQASQMSVPPAAASPASKPVDPAFLAAEKAYLALDIEVRRAIQRDLMWVANFAGTASGDFGPLTFAALKRFETEAKLPVDGILSAPKQTRLAALANAQRQAAKFTVETDKLSGMKIGIPGVVFVKSSPNASGGTRWQDRDEKVTLDLAVYKKEDSLATLFEKGTDPKVAGRKITYKLLRPDFFVISGETATGKFYRRVQADPALGLRGFSVGYDKSVAPVLDRFVIAIAGAYEPFPRAGGVARTEARSGPGPVVAAVSTQRRATGLVVAPEAIYAPEAALKGCTAVSVLADAPPEVISAAAIRSLAPGVLALKSPRAARATPFRLARPVDGPATLVQRDVDGKLLASPATIEGRKVATAMQEGGAGAALFDPSGALVGIVQAAPVLKFRVAGVVPQLRYEFTPAGEALKADELPVPAAGQPAKSAAEIGENVRDRIVSLVCTSDK